MSLIINLGGMDSATPTGPSNVRSSAPTTPPDNAPAQDTVEISSASRALADTMADSSFRIARVNAIREEVANGTYETPDRIEGTVSRLLDMLG